MPISISEARVSPSSVKARLRRLALDLGFHDLRVTTPAGIGAAGERLRHFLEQGQHGDMEWLERNAERRADPAALWSDVRSILMVGSSYAPDDDPLAALNEPKRGAISCYARGKDYHDVVKRGLIVIAREIADKLGAQVRVLVDTAPLMEKPLAQAAGLGWQGKHTNLVSRTAGSWLFLGAILTDAVIEADHAEIDHCGNCRRCLEVCPTAAFPGPYQLDARRCIAYLTIEYKGHIAAEFREAIGNRVFGCDDCLAICPWNKFAEASQEMRFRARVETDNPPLAELLALDDAAFRLRFAGTPIKRTGRNRFVRNVLIAAGNSGDEGLIPAVLHLIDDASPLVRAMAVWAARRLLATDAFQALRRERVADESDADVLAEWNGMS